MPIAAEIVKKNQLKKYLPVPFGLTYIYVLLAE